MSIVLVVEDEAFIREVAVMMIEECGYTALAASDVETALVLLRSPQPINLLFTDIYLKAAVFGGCDLARDAMQIRPNLRVLYTTGNSATDGLKSLFVDGSRFIGKPYTPHQLQSSVKALLSTPI